MKIPNWLIAGFWFVVFETFFWLGDDFFFRLFNLERSFGLLIWLTIAFIPSMYFFGMFVKYCAKELRGDAI